MTAPALDSAWPDLDDTGYGWHREQRLEDGDPSAEIAIVCVIIPGIFCDMGSRCANGPGGHWWRDTCRTP